MSHNDRRGACPGDAAYTGTGSAMYQGSREASHVEFQQGLQEVAWELAHGQRLATVGRTTGSVAEDTEVSSPLDFEKCSARQLSCSAQ